MPEQANNVSSWLSPIINSAKSGRADLTASAKEATGKGTGFSNDLDQARQQQFNKVHAESAQRNSRKEGNPESATVVRHAPAGASIGLPSGSVASRPVSDSLANVTGEFDVTGRSVPVEVDASGNPVLPETSQKLTAEAKQNNAGGNDLLASLASSASVSTPTPVSTEKTAVAAPAPAAAAATTKGLPTAPNTNTAGPVLNPVTAQLREEHSSESTPVAPNAVLNPQASVISAGVPSGTVREIAAKVTLAGQASGSNATVADDGVVAPPVLLMEEGLDVNTGRLSKEQPLDVTVRKTTMEPGAVMTNAATLASSASVSTPTPVSTEKTAVAAPAHRHRRRRRNNERIADSTEYKYCRCRVEPGHRTTA